MAHQDTDVFVRLERFYDTLPRHYARAEEIGTLVLFVREGEGWPYYARPMIGAETPSAADIAAVRSRQRELGVPEAFEWVHETNPDLLAVARSAGLQVLLAPLLVLDPAALLPDLPITGATLRVLDPAGPGFPADLAISRAVANLGFGSPASITGTESGALVIAVAGPSERDAATEELSAAMLESSRASAAAGSYVTAVAEAGEEGIVATGTLMRSDDVAEIAGVATLPSARRRGYASQLTATLARTALHGGAPLVFLSAGDDDIARLYTRVGFRRVGTACIAEPQAATI